jgi:hypothetical protein
LGEDFLVDKSGVDVSAGIGLEFMIILTYFKNRFNN